MNIFAHAGHDHTEGLMQDANSTLVVIAVIFMLIAAVIVTALVYDVVTKHRAKE